MVRLVWLSLLVVACSGNGPAGEDAASAIDASAGSDAAPVDADDAGPEPDPCEGIVAACPTPAGLVEGQGLVAIDRCAFPLEARDRWADTGAILDELATRLPVVGVADVLADLNRTAVTESAAAVPGDPPGVQQAFSWQSGDMSVDYWIPQGITTSGNAIPGGRVDNRNVVLVSWYYEQANDEGSTQAKGVRIAIVDATDPQNVDYRFALLVEPTNAGGVASFAPVNVHAGGLAWVGRYLYVVHTGIGFRIFDLDRMMKVSTGKDVLGYDAADDAYYAHGYAYVLPQVETIANAGECAPRFSFVSLDRTTTPPSLLSGEYDATSVAGRLHRWPLADDGRPALVGTNRLIPDAAYYSGHSHIQGALSLDGTYWLSSSKPAAGAGVLYRTAPDAPTTNIAWNDAPEDLAFDPIDAGIWSLSEGLNARFVFRVARTAVE